jgi:hypothetical protein
LREFDERGLELIGQIRQPRGLGPIGRMPHKLPPQLFKGLMALFVRRGCVACAAQCEQRQ